MLLCDSPHDGQTDTTALSSVAGLKRLEHLENALLKRLGYSRAIVFDEQQEPSLLKRSTHGDLCIGARVGISIRQEVLEDLPNAQSRHRAVVRFVNDRDLKLGEVQLRQNVLDDLGKTHVNPRLRRPCSREEQQIIQQALHSDNTAFEESEVFFDFAAKRIPHVLFDKTDQLRHTVEWRFKIV